MRMLPRTEAASPTQVVGHPRLPGRLGLGGGPGGDERRRHEVLDGAVVQGAGDPAALGVGGLDGAFEQQLALALGLAEAAQQAPQDGRGEDDEHQQAAQRDAGEPARQLAAALARPES